VGAVAVVNAGTVPLAGHAAIDVLNAAGPGLRTIELWPASGAVFLRFPDQANPRAL